MDHLKLERVLGNEKVAYCSSYYTTERRLACHELNSTAVWSSMCRRKNEKLKFYKLDTSWKIAASVIWRRFVW
jgi:hypothetical protein